MKISIHERVFHFLQPAGTSRGVYRERRSWFLECREGQSVGWGECAPLPHLSCDDIPDYADVLRAFCDQVEQTGTIDYEAMRNYPSMLFGLETALLHLKNGERLFDTPFSRGEEGIRINGLVWMGTYEEMFQRLQKKLSEGFRCIKLKVGAIDFNRELDLVRHVRERFGPRDVELRLDANGGFDFDEALYRLELLSQYAVHSIEQPIMAGQWANMAMLCREAPLPIALDEELIGINDPEQKRQLLHIIKPAYIILKPSLHGGMRGCREWVDLARQLGIDSWMTSALESNVGLHAIAQLCSALYDHPIDRAQGLGTGLLYADNIDMPLTIEGDRLWISQRS